MKIKLNIKGKKKLYQKINLPILAAFILSVIMAAVWIKMTYNTHIEYSKKIKERTEQNAILKLKSNKKEAEIKVIENKQYVDSSFLNTLYQKIEFLEKFTDVEKTAFLFFDGLEKAVTGEIFINNILSKDKNNEFDIEGISSNADNISELVKKLQANPIYSKVELVQITGGVKESKNMNFKVALAYEKDPLLEFSDKSKTESSPGEAKVK